MNQPDSLLETVRHLFALFAERQVKYVLAGGVAMLAYVEGRNTQDIDLILSVDSLAQLPEILISSQDRDFAKGEFQGLQIDFLLTTNRLFAKVGQHYVTSQRFFEQEIPTTTVEGLVLLKLYALPSLYRQGNFVKVGLYENDIATLMHFYRPQVRELVEILRQYLGENDISEVVGIVDEIEGRLKRFRER